ncbi:hypothetical protein AOG2_23800 [Geobacter sp. AOG2]|nr:hypothetical protein AOG2_23800 [Geobacter sp. AOG2]
MPEPIAAREQPYRLCRLSSAPAETPPPPDRGMVSKTWRRHEFGTLT